MDRNAVKRRMREAYRLNKQQQLYTHLQASNKQIILSVGYIGKAIERYDLMEKKMIKLLVQLSAELAK
ncbi:hypothetical protein [Mucilaginibacter antarcticus]|uniref:hypothetical protein n=1 Tax=Mucilaginibacter antarcticus TaxID=1855725 RepID=UPI00362A00BC